MFGQQRYLRLRTPITVDGRNFKYDAFNQPMFREDEAPITALPHIKKLNEDLAAAGNHHLQTKWEEVQSEVPVHTGKDKRKLKTLEEIKAEMKAELLEDLRASGIIPAEDPKPVKKGKKAVAVDEEI